MVYLPSLKGLRAIEAAARLGSFIAASGELNVTQTAVSRLVKMVEQQLGQRLFDRHANALSLTPAGRDLAPLLADAFRRLESAVAGLQRRPAGPVVTVATGPTFAMRWLIPRLPDFQRRHPGIEVRVTTAIGAPAELKADWTASIRLGSGPPRGLAGDRLFGGALFPVCAPGLAAGLKAPKDLRNVTLLEVAHAPRDWPDWLGAAGIDPAAMRRRSAFDYSAYAIQAALDGLGVALAREPYVADDLAAGRLVKPFAQAFTDASRGWHLIYQTAARDDAAFRAFRDWLLAMRNDAPQKVQN